MRGFRPICIPACLILAAQLAPADEASQTQTVEIDSFKLTVPETWKATEPTPAQRQFRKAQFEIPAVEGDSEPAELVIFYFGPQGGGGVGPNIERWVGQFDAKGRKAKITTGDSDQGKYVFVDISGTYNKPIGPPIQQKTEAMPGARMLGVILEVGDDGSYFFKLAGPERTVTAAATDLRNSIGAKAENEREYSE